jgi:hypothetical protein
LLCAEELKELPAAYLELTKQRAATSGMQQTNPTKGAFACLYLLAAICLSSAAHMTHGYKVLDIASQLNRNRGGAETSETYGEIVWAIADDRVRETIILGMRRDNEGRAAVINLMRKQRISSDANHASKTAEIFAGSVLEIHIQISEYVRGLIWETNNG